MRRNEEFMSKENIAQEKEKRLSIIVFISSYGLEGLKEGGGGGGGGLLFHENDV